MKWWNTKSSQGCVISSSLKVKGSVRKEGRKESKRQPFDGSIPTVSIIEKNDFKSSNWEEIIKEFVLFIFLTIDIDRYGKVYAFI